KWLETISLTPHSLTPDERNILTMVRNMLEETEYAVPVPPSSSHPPSTSSVSSSGTAAANSANSANANSNNNANATSAAAAAATTAAAAPDNTSPEAEAQRIRALGAAVVRLWAETFKGTQIFDIVRAMGRALEVYGEGMERGGGVGV
ncbi:hypothetical protein V494_00836, partial [Pseudogymnoascus sp. VKM F-4513 (FW-928)]